MDKRYSAHHFNTNSAKSYIGKTINLYLKDGSVMACVQVQRVTNSRLWVKASKHGKPQLYPLKDISRIDISINDGVNIYDTSF